MPSPLPLQARRSQWDRVCTAAALSSTRTSNWSGSGVDQTVIHGGGMVITVDNGASVAISGVTITGGRPDYSLPDPAPSRRHPQQRRTDGQRQHLHRATRPGSGIGGGGIYNNGSLSLIRTVVRRNGTGGSYNSGGGIYNNGKVVLTDSSVDENGGFLGGGIRNGGTMTLTRTLGQRQQRRYRRLAF